MLEFIELYTLSTDFLQPLFNHLTNSKRSVAAEHANRSATASCRWPNWPCSTCCWGHAYLVPGWMQAHPEDLYLNLMINCNWLANWMIMGKPVSCFNPSIKQLQSRSEHCLVLIHQQELLHRRSWASCSPDSADINLRTRPFSNS